MIQKSAIFLRDQVLRMETKSLPENVTVEDIFAGECSIPDELKKILLTLVGGTRVRRLKNDDCQRKATSLCFDVINAITKGHVKTSKHLTLGIALKSMTSCRKVIDLLNRFGHCCSYHVLEEMETELTFSSTDRDELCPMEIIKTPKLNAGVAYDNYDRYVETRIGKDTLHDTVGIIYQDIDEQPTSEHTACS